MREYKLLLNTPLTSDPLYQDQYRTCVEKGIEELKLSNLIVEFLWGPYKEEGHDIYLYCRLNLTAEELIQIGVKLGEYAELYNCI